jgi:hypothetical protein
LPREDPDFDLRLIEPASMGRRVMDGETVPDFSSHFRPEHICQRLLGVDIQIIHDQVNRFGCRVSQRQMDRYLDKLKARPIRCGEGEVTTCLGGKRPLQFGRELLTNC